MLKPGCIFYTLILLILPGFLTAQNYQTVNSGRIAYFERYSSDFGCVRIDSVKSETDSILFPSINFQSFDGYCFTPGHWLSSRIILQQSGDNLFFNRKNDTIRIKTKAALNDSWICYELPDSVSIISTLVSNEIASFLGLQDSVKVISFKYFDKNMNPVDHEINELTIAISKSYGLVKTLDFNNFPEYVHSDNQEYSLECNLCGLSDPKTGFQDFSWFEAHDFHTGDEIHVLTEEVAIIPGATGYYTISSNKKTIDKYINRTDYPDSIIYKIDRIERMFDSAKGISYSHDTIIKKIVAYPDFDHLPGEPVIHENSAFVNALMSFSDLPIKTVYDKTFYLFENCWTTPIEDGCLTKQSYIKGLGGPYSYCSGGIEGYSEYSCFPVYYKKADSSWGTPLIIDAIPQTTIEKKIDVYPNPAKDEIRINSSLPSGPFTFELIDQTGRLIFKTVHPDTHSAIKLTSCYRGIYFYRILLDGKVYVGKVVLSD